MSKKARDSKTKALAALDEAIAQQQAQGEPVAWTALTGAGAVDFGKDWVFSPIKTGRADVPLYTRPAPGEEAQIRLFP